MSHHDSPSQVTEDTPLVVTEMPSVPVVGQYIGQCKWFSDKLGYGFVTIQNGDHKGKDIFVHHSGIKPLNSNYKTLKKGEYIDLNIVHGVNGLQAVDVTGILGGSLMCDVLPTPRNTVPTDHQHPHATVVSAHAFITPKSATVKGVNQKRAYSQI